MPMGSHIISEGENGMAAKKLFFLAVKEMSLSIVLRRNEVREGYVAEEVAASARRMRALQPVSNPYCPPPISPVR